MWTNDKITNGAEIKTADFKLKDSPFYLFIAPKSDTFETVLFLKCQLNDGAELVDFPFVVGTWNPVVVKNVKIPSSLNSGYRFFYGLE